jgi:hypothetical protein
MAESGLSRPSPLHKSILRRQSDNNRGITVISFVLTSAILVSYKVELTKFQVIWPLEIIYSSVDAVELVRAKSGRNLERVVKI